MFHCHVLLIGTYGNIFIVFKKFFNIFTSDICSTTGDKKTVSGNDRAFKKNPPLNVIFPYGANSTPVNPLPPRPVMEISPLLTITTSSAAGRQLFET
jgi:hypothetical protein